MKNKKLKAFLSLMNELGREPDLIITNKKKGNKIKDRKAAKARNGSNCNDSNCNAPEFDGSF